MRARVRASKGVYFFTEAPAELHNSMNLGRQESCMLC